MMIVAPAGGKGSTKYLSTLSAWLKMAEMLLGFIVSLLLTAWNDSCTISSARFLHLTSFTFLVYTSVHFIAVLIRPSAEKYMNTSLNLIYHIVAVIFYFCGFLGTIVQSGAVGTVVGIGIGLLGFMTTVIYLVDVIVIYKNRAITGVESIVLTNKFANEKT